MSWEAGLKTMVPKKFRRSQRFVGYVESLGEWMDLYPQAKLDGLVDIIDITNVPIQYVQYLADTLGLVLSQFLGVDDTSLRRQVENSVDWYKIKGTYRAITVILYTVQLSATVYDLYSLDYENFVRMNWFSLGAHNPQDYELVAGTYQNGMFKTPHFDIQIELTRSFGTSPDLYLITGDQFTIAKTLVEEVRPANTVPHYYARAKGSASKNFLVNTDSSSHISTVVIQTNWQELTYTFDNAAGIKTLDAGNILDFTVASFLQSWNVFKIGTGNVATLPSKTATGLANPVFTGSVSNIVVGTNTAVFTMDIPQSYAKSGITELGIFNSTGTNLQVLVTHPAINKVDGYTLRYEITVSF
jgi:hypothetical protein